MMEQSQIMEQPQATTTLTFFSLSAFLDAWSVWGRYAISSHEDVARRRWMIVLPRATVARDASIEGSAQ